MPPADPDRGGEWTEALQRANFSFHKALQDRERYLVDLTLSEDRQLASLGAQWRANLKKASRELEISEPDLKTGIPAFMALYRDMLGRKKFNDHHGIENLPVIAERAGRSLGMRLFLREPSRCAGGRLHRHRLRRARVRAVQRDRRRGARPARGYALRWAIIGRLRAPGRAGSISAAPRATRDFAATSSAMRESSGGSSTSPANTITRRTRCPRRQPAPSSSAATWCGRPRSGSLWPFCRFDPIGFDRLRARF